MFTYNGTAVLQFDSPVTGNAGSGVTVTVRGASTPVAGLGGLANIYNFNESAIPNPLTTDSKGNYTFKALNGTYDIILSEGDPTEVILPSQQFVDLTEVSIGVAQEVQTLTDGQTVVTFTSQTTTSAEFHINGQGVDSRLLTSQDINGALTTTTTITLFDSYPGGSIVTLSKNTDAGNTVAGIVIPTVEEEVVLTDGQLVVTFSTLTTEYSEFHINGIGVDSRLLTSDDINHSLTTPSTITLFESYPVGSIVTLAQNSTKGNISVDITNNIIKDLSQAYIFETVTEYKTSAIAFPVGKTIHLNDRQADFTVVGGTGTGNDINIIASTSVSQSINIVQVAGFNTLEQLGYDAALENAHTVINTASLAGIQIKVTDNKFLFSDTIYIYSNGLVLTTETGDFSGAKLQASASFDDTKLLVDTVNYDYLVANSVKVTTPDGGGIGAPKGTTILGVEFLGNYNASTLAAPLIDEGIGARIYGGYTRLNLKVSNVFNVGVLTYYPEGVSGVAGNNDNVIITVSEITIHTLNTGREGYVFDGPPDAILGNVSSRDAASSNFGLQDVTPVDSVQYAGDTEKLCPAIDIRKACHHKGFMNGFGNRNGWSTHITNNRFDSSGQVQVDSSDGGLRIAPDGRGQIANIEFHSMTYGFINHSGSLRPCILNESVTGFTCKNIKGYLEGNYQGRNLVDVKGVGANMDIIVAPIFSNAPSNMGQLLNIEGRQHNVNIGVSSTIAFSKGVVFGELFESNVSGQLHFIGDDMVDFSGMDATRDKSNTIAIVGRTSTGNSANILSGLAQLTRQDLTETKVSVYSTTNAKTYSTQPSTRSADVIISNGSKTTSHSHNYTGTPNLDEFVIGFHPATTATVMPEITNVRISSVSGFSVEVKYDVLGGSGSMFISSKINI